MIDMPVPADIAAKAADVERWVREQETRKVSDAEFAAMPPRDRLDYCRRHPAANDIDKPLPWQNPRKG